METSVYQMLINNIGNADVLIEVKFLTTKDLKMEKKKKEVKSKIPSKFRSGTLVYVQDKDLLANSFYSWLPCQVFAVSSDEKGNGIITGKRYVWVESYSTGLPIEAIRVATPKQRKQYVLEKKKGKYTNGYKNLFR